MRLSRIIYCLSLVLIAGCSSEKAVNSSIHLDTPDESYLKGVQEARRDVDRGIYRIKKRGMPVYSNYEILLKRKYGIKTDIINGYFVLPAMDAFVRGYNQVSRDAIEKKYGSDFWKRATKESEDAQVLAELKNDMPEDCYIYSINGSVWYRINAPEKSETRCKIMISKIKADEYKVFFNISISKTYGDKTENSESYPTVIVKSDKWAVLKIENDKEKLNTLVDVDGEKMLIEHGLGIYLKIKVMPKNSSGLKVVGFLLYSKLLDDGEENVQIFPLNVDCELDIEKCFYLSNVPHKETE